MRAQRASKPLPDRVLVYGVTGSGKSTAALAIGERTGHPVTLVDELTWLPGWVPVEESVQREVIGRIVAGERWLLDSSYGAWLDLVLPRTQLIIGLDYPRWISLFRLVRRTVSGAITREPRCNGNVESWRNMLSSRSIIRWHFRSFVRKRDRMRAWAACPEGPQVLLFRRPRELDAWLASLGGGSHDRALRLFRTPALTACGAIHRARSQQVGVSVVAGTMDACPPPP